MNLLWEHGRMLGGDVFLEAGGHILRKQRTFLNFFLKSLCKIR